MIAKSKPQIEKAKEVVKNNSTILFNKYVRELNI